MNLEDLDSLKSYFLQSARRIDIQLQAPIEARNTDEAKNFCECINILVDKAKIIQGFIDNYGEDR